MTLFLITFITWALLHSITAAFSTKQFVRTLIGEAVYDGLYRLGYNLFASITFLPVLYMLAKVVPSTAVWNIPSPFNILFLIIRWGGMIGFLISLFQTDIWDFAGLAQAKRYLSGDETITLPARLVVSGTYNWVRHPLYLFSLLYIWFSPYMTMNGFIFNMLITIYFWIGSSYEEKRLNDEFGEAYAAYKKRVPRIFPIKIKG